MMFNEHDAFPAEWLRQLWPDATVDERSIADLAASDVRDHGRVHLFAGIGGWEYALGLAGWDSTRPVWTGSCPCQPFSVAGRGRGTADERHLWPEMRRLVAECRPDTIFGEQVASRAGREWLAGVQLDLEALGYAFGAVDLSAAGVGAPHIRQRLIWVANANESRLVWSEKSDFRASTGKSASFRRHADRCRVDDPWANAAALEFTDGKRRRCKPGLVPMVAGLPRAVVRSGDPGAPIDPNASAEARVGRLRGYGNAIVPQLAAAFIRAFLDVEASR